MFVIQKLFVLRMASSYHYNRERKSCQTFSSALSSAAAEWLLILLIYLDGFFSYLATKFAHYCNLQIPCLLCSRLDHLIGFRKFGLYKDLICQAHKLEISSLTYCHVHKKLSDAHEVCDICLLSTATDKKPNTHAFISLIGSVDRNIGYGGKPPTGAIDTEVLGINSKGEDAAQLPFLKRDQIPDSPRTRYCSCCNELFNRKSHVQRLLQTKAIEHGDGLLGQAAQNCFQYRDRTNRIRERSLMSPTASRIGNRGFDRLSHIGYTQLKLSSDSESDVSFSNEDDGHAPVGVRQSKEHSLSTNLRSEPVKSEKNNEPKAFSDSFMQEKLIHATPNTPDSSCMVTFEQHQIADRYANNSSMSEICITRQLSDLNWNEFGRKEHPSTPVSHTPRGNKSFEEANIHVPAQGAGSNPLPAKEKLEVSDLESGEMGTSDATVSCSTTYVETPKDFIPTRTELKHIQTTHKVPSSVINLMDPNDAFKLTVGHRMSQPSPRSPSRYHEDLKLFFTHISASRGLDYLSNDAIPSPRAQGQLDESKIDMSSAMNNQNLGKKFINDRNEPSFELLDAVLIDEIEGESPTDHMKRQIELDRKFMSLLYKELEEERNASAIAANQAMAMITRLQEEKAAMQMEALQYQRMMEEQAEYDHEALQETGDLLTEKEKEIQDLEAEIESYKRRLGEDEVLSDAGCIRATILNDSLLDFEGERKYISECLERLRKKLSTLEESGRSDSEGKQSNTVNRVTDITILENEVSNLSGRLSALETEIKLLEHSIKLFRYGNGVRFIEEIASALQELLSVGIRNREQTDI